MTEAEAKLALAVPRETIGRLETFVALLQSENEVQNLVSPSTLPSVWSRHILDCAQLVDLAPANARSWLDIGSGAGLPGLIVAMLHRSILTLVEPRRLRADFLRRAAEATQTSNVEIICTKVEKLEPRSFDVISARAVTSLDRLLALGQPFSRPETCWLLPKGRSVQSELEAAKASWQGEFRLEPSLTDPDARIVVATGVRRKAEGKRTR